ncbi:MAG: DUF3300 domain-containing protein [Pseudomonadota bacterium]
MKTRLILFLSLGLVAPALLPAQEPTPPPAAAMFTPGQLDQLLGPIALYPDALIALILPAAATPSDIVLAARYLQGGGDPAQVDNQPWDDSVTALAHYPDVVQWMDQNLAWTKQLGEVFVAQPAAVMQAVQRLRTEARAAGTLADTPQQVVVMDGPDISIVPAQVDVIYVPRYDPDVVYYADPSGSYAGPYLTFGAGFAAGAWLTYDVDWGHRRIWVIDRHDPHYNWRDHRDWQHPVFPGRPGYVRDPARHLWNAPPNFDSARPAPARKIAAQVVQPPPLPGAPPRPPGWRRPASQDNPHLQVQSAPSPGRVGPGQPQPPPSQPLPSLRPQPSQAQESRPAQAGPQPSERRGNPSPPPVEREERDRRGRESQGAQVGTAPPPRASPPPQAAQAPAARQSPPKSPPAQADDDEKRKQRGE